MKSIFKNIADKCHSQAKELVPNGINFGPYEEFKGPPTHTNQRCTMTPMENKMIEIKTETHEGNVYQIGKPYLFSLSGATWFYDKLINIDAIFNLKPFGTKSGEWSYIKEVPSYEPMGTITPAPVELVDGAAYMFNSHRNNLLDAIGVYSKFHNTLTTFNNLCSEFDCTHIRLMTVEKK